MRIAKKLISLVALFWSMTSLSQDFSKVKISVEKLGPGMAMLKGAGGNIGVSYGADGIFLIDDQYAPLHDRIIAALKTLSDQPVRYVINTHWHGDHTGGNEKMSSKGSVVVAHRNVRKRMNSKQMIELFQRKVAPSPSLALPVITFDSEIDFYLNGQRVKVVHVSNAHTDGDALAYFEKSNILHMGDTFFNGFYPFIDRSSGGTIDGLIKAIETALTMANDSTKIIPGHGQLATKKDLIGYLAMLKGSRTAVSNLVKKGQTLDAIQKADPLKELNPTWGKGFIKPKVFVKVLYQDLGGK